MRFLVSIAMAVLLFVFCSSLSINTYRVLTISVINDSSAPVDAKRITEVLTQTSKEFQEKVGVRLVVKEAKNCTVNLDQEAIDIAFQLRRNKCYSKPTDVRIVFSNIDLHKPAEIKGEKYVDKASAKPDWIAGGAKAAFGLVYICDAARTYIPKTDAEGNCSVVTGLKHELGHIFGEEHSSDQCSFMYSPSCHSSGLWTENVQKNIKRKKWKDFYFH